jgi:hypothetical protein
MTIKLSAAREAELLADYKARKTAIDSANDMLDKMRADQKLKQEAFWAKINTPHIHKLQSQQKCNGCGCTIPVGAKALVKAKIHNVSGMGWNGQFLTEYTCAVCAKLLSNKVTL